MDPAARGVDAVGELAQGLAPLGPVPAEQNGPCAHTPAGQAQASPLVSLLLLVILLAALVVLLARGMNLEEALAVLGASGLLAVELRQRLL